MKKFSLIFRYASSTLVVLAALAFTVLEGTLLVSLDFALYEDRFLALVQLLLRLLIALSALALGVFAMIKRERSFLPHSLCLLASTAVMIPFVSDNVGVYLTAVSAIFALSQLLSSRLRD